MRRLLYSVCILLIMNAAALGQSWPAGWTNLKNPTFMTITLMDSDTDTLGLDPSSLNVLYYRDGSTPLFLVDSTGKTGVGVVPTFGLHVEHASGFNFKDTTYDLSIETGVNLIKLRDVGSAADIILYNGGDGSLTFRTVANANVTLIPGSGKVDVDGGFVSDTYNFAADSQGDDDYEIAIPEITALTTGLMVTFTANTANTDGATLEITSVGDLDAILKMHDQALATGDIESGQVVVCIFDGTNWQMTSQLGQ